MAEIRFHGPVFTPAAKLLFNTLTKDIETKVAAETRRRVVTLEHAFFRHPTGYYESRTRAKPRSDYHVVTDSGVIYGPWLEGIGSRNRTTRFKGYFFWRKAYQSMIRSGAMQVAKPMVQRAVNALNG